MLCGRVCVWKMVNASCEVTGEVTALELAGGARLKRPATEEASCGAKLTLTIHTTYKQCLVRRDRNSPACFITSSSS